ncbi:hypothetical protein GBA52_013959 [Prunus armeniaca]|nr:hypothetical protein GBA52_013959 [Prunus armeniaca]
MKVGRDFRTGLNRFLTSWKNASDPSLGEYTYGIDNLTLPQLVVAKGSKKLFRTGPWNGVQFSGTPDSGNKRVVKPIYVYDTNEFYYMYEVAESSILTRVKLSETGLAQRLVLNEGSTEWAVMYTLLNDRCDNYRECGANGICRTSKSPSCECLQGWYRQEGQKGYTYLGHISSFCASFSGFVMLVYTSEEERKECIHIHRLKIN